MSSPSDPYAQQPRYPSQNPPPAYPPQGAPQVYYPGPYQQSPQGPGRKRHTARNVLLIVGGAMAVLIVIGAVASAGGGRHKTPASVAGAASKVTTAPPSPAPPPAPSPAGNISGSCDVSLSTSLYGQDYLTAQVSADNTGNIGTIVRVKVSWPLQGFAPITRTRTVRVAAGATSQVEFHAAVSVDQVSEFQDEQLSANGADPCHYNGVITSTWGQPTS